MFERLVERGATIGAARVERVINQLASGLDVPKGVTLARSARGLLLIGKRLRMRFITDPRLRAIAALAQGVVR